MTPHYTKRGKIGNLTDLKCGSCENVLIYDIKLTGKFEGTFPCECCGHNTRLELNNPDLTLKDTSFIGKPMVIHKQMQAEKVEASA